VIGQARGFSLAEISTPAQYLKRSSCREALSNCLGEDVYVHMYIYIYSECHVFEKIPDRMAVCAEFFVDHPLQITSTHRHIRAHTRSNLGLVERKGYMSYCDCPKESDEVVFCWTKTPDLSCCLKNSSQSLMLLSSGNSDNYYRNRTEYGKAL